MREEGQHRVHIITKVRSLWADRVIWYELCASLRRYYPVQVVRVRSKVR